MAQARVRYGYRKILALWNREGWKGGRYLGYRLYKEEGWTLRPRPRRRRRLAVHRGERLKPPAANQVGRLDFVADPLTDGRRFRALPVVAIDTREGLAIQVGQSLKGEAVGRVLNPISAQRGGAKGRFCDNGSEFSSQAMARWA
jgi:putative transposase